MLRVLPENDKGCYPKGVAVYAFFAPKKEQKDCREGFLSRDAILERTHHKPNRSGLG